MTNTYYIPHAKTCELAHQMLLNHYKLNKLDIKSMDTIDKNGETIYSISAQLKLNDYVAMIENIMLDEEIDTELTEQKAKAYDSIKETYADYNPDHNIIR